MRIYTNPVFHLHGTGPGHPESPSRLDWAMDGVARAGALPLVTERLTDTDATDSILARVHRPEYTRDFERACRDGHRFFHTYDNPISVDTFAAATSAVASALTAVEDIWIGRECSKGLVIARPPGHHAERDTAMGFCFFNTIACAAERTREMEGVTRVLILDWDVHHGNGTQALFEDRDDVFYLSIHRYPFFPGTGAADEIGRGAGKGYTKNIPLEVGGTDTDYVHAFESIVMPMIDDYSPDAILISAGFDAHVLDPLGGMRVSGSAFAEMTSLVLDAAERHCHGRLLSILEGGYDPEGLAESVAAHVTALIGSS